MEYPTPDIELVNKVKRENDSVSLMELIDRHTPLCTNIYNKYTPHILATGLCLDDVIKDKDYVFWQSVLSYDPSKNVKFSTWLGHQIKYQCLNAIHNSGDLVAMEDKDLEYHIDEVYHYVPEDNTDTMEYINTLLSQLKDPRIKKIFELRYFSAEKMTWREIGAILNISNQTAINLHDKGKKLLQQKLLSNSCVDTV